MPTETQMRRKPSLRHADIEHLLPEHVQIANIRKLPDAPKGKQRGGPIYFARLIERKKEIAKHKPEVLGGRPKTNFTRAQVEEDAMKRLLPRALAVLEEQLEAHDPRVRQAAAIKVVEYNKGKPTQTIQQDLHQVSRIVYESAAWMPGADVIENAEFEAVALPELDPASEAE